MIKSLCLISVRNNQTAKFQAAKSHTYSRTILVRKIQQITTVNLLFCPFSCFTETKFPMKHYNTLLHIVALLR